MHYRPTEEWQHIIHVTTSHTDVVIQDVIPLAKKYNNPYATGLSNGPVFEEFPIEALPVDSTDGDLIKHTYPPLEFSDLYFEAALRQLKDLQSELHTVRSYVHRVASSYQLLINLHYFSSINTSLYMNIANVLLEAANINGVEHDIKDFVAIRLQPKNYQAYFYKEILRHNSQHLIPISSKASL